VPARKQVQFIPGALAMAEEDKGSGHDVDGRSMAWGRRISTVCSGVTNVECL
jgi:hypothetical protein